MEGIVRVGGEAGQPESVGDESEGVVGGVACLVRQHGECAGQCDSLWVGHEVACQEGGGGVAGGGQTGAVSDQLGEAGVPAVGEVLLVVVPAGGDGARRGPGGNSSGVVQESLVCVVRGGKLRHGPGVDGGGESWVGGGLVVARADQSVRRPVNPGGVGGVVGAVAGAQGAGAHRLLLGIEPLPVGGCSGGVGGVAEREVGQGACEVGERDAGEGGEVPGRVVVEVEFGRGQGAVAVEGDTGPVQELGKRQLVGDSEALGV